MESKKRKQLFLLISLILLLFIVNYPFFDNALENFLQDKETVFVERVIDGDTIVGNKMHIRLLGINAPEITKKEKYSQEAKEFLGDAVLNKKIELKFGKDRQDRYHRILAYLFINGKNINLELVKKGLANFYFPSGKDVYYKNFKKAWESCLKTNKNLCEMSKDKCANCINLNEFNYKNQIVIFYNNCSFNCDLTNWDIKDEGRKHFKFHRFILRKFSKIEIKVGEGQDSDKILFWKKEKYVWTKSGDSLFLRDKEKRLVLWKNY